MEHLTVFSLTEPVRNSTDPDFARFIDAIGIVPFLEFNSFFKQNVTIASNGPAVAELVVL